MNDTFSGSKVSNNFYNSPLFIQEKYSFQASEPAFYISQGQYLGHSGK